MSPYTVRVSIAGSEVDLDASISNPNNIGVRYMCIRTVVEGCSPVTLFKYTVVKERGGYVLLRPHSTLAGTIRVGKTLTLASCQVLSLADFCETHNIKVIE